MNNANNSSYSKDESESIRADKNIIKRDTINDFFEQEGEITLLDKPDKRQRLLSVLLADFKWTINTEGKVSYINPYIENCIGIDARYVIKKIASRFLTQSSIVACLIELEELTEMMRTSKNVKSRTLIVDTLENESKVGNVEIKSSAIFDLQGNIVGIQGLCYYVPK